MTDNRDAERLAQIARAHEGCRALPCDVCFLRALLGERDARIADLVERAREAFEHNLRPHTENFGDLYPLDTARRLALEAIDTIIDAGRQAEERGRTEGYARAVEDAAKAIDEIPAASYEGRFIGNMSRNHAADIALNVASDVVRALSPEPREVKS